MGVYKCGASDASVASSEDSRADWVILMARLQSLERQQASMYQTVTIQGAILHRVESRPQTSVEEAAWASREMEVLQARVAI